MIDEPEFGCYYNQLKAMTKKARKKTLREPVDGANLQRTSMRPVPSEPEARKADAE